VEEKNRLSEHKENKKNNLAVFSAKRFDIYFSKNVNKFLIYRRIGLKMEYTLNKGRLEYRPVQSHRPKVKSTIYQNYKNTK